MNLSGHLIIVIYLLHPDDSGFSKLMIAVRPSDPSVCTRDPSCPPLVKQPFRVRGRILSGSSVIFCEGARGVGGLLGDSLFASFN